MAGRTITVACPRCQSTEIGFDAEDSSADHATRRYRVGPVQCPSCDTHVSLAVRGIIYGDISPVHTLSAASPARGVTIHDPWKIVPMVA